MYNEIEIYMLTRAAATGGHGGFSTKKSRKWATNFFHWFGTKSPDVWTVAPPLGRKSAFVKFAILQRNLATWPLRDVNTLPRDVGTSAWEILDLLLIIHFANVRSSQYHSQQMASLLVWWFCWKRGCFHSVCTKRFKEDGIPGESRGTSRIC